METNYHSNCSATNEHVDTTPHSALCLIVSVSTTSYNRCSSSSSFPYEESIAGRGEVIFKLDQTPGKLGLKPRQADDRAPNFKNTSANGKKQTTRLPAVQPVALS